MICSMKLYNMKSAYQCIPACLVLILLSFISHAQLNVQKYEIGAVIGGYIYQGDLTPEPAGSFRTMMPGINLYGSKILSRSFSVRANLAFSVLRGDDAAYQHPEYRQHRNFNFSSPVGELSGLLVWNLLGKNYAIKGCLLIFLAEQELVF